MQLSQEICSIGNELGVLFGVWQILQYKRSRPVGSSERAAVLASVVSSRMLKAVAEAEGIEYYDTLTGRSKLLL